MSRSGAEPGHARGSIRRRLPLLIAALLLTTIAAFGWAAYLEVETALLDASHHRLLSVSRQLATLLAQSLQQRIEEARRLGADPAVRKAIASADPVAGRGAQARLDAFLAANPQTLGVELWHGPQRLAGATLATSAGPTRAPPLGTTPPAQLGFTPLLAAGPLAYYELIAPVTTADGSDGASVPSYLVLRRAASSPGTAVAVASLVGTGMLVQFGAANAGVWTDLSAVIARPPLPETPGTVMTYTDPQGEPMLRASAPMTQTPWLVSVAMPRQMATAPARAFLAHMLPLGGAVVLFGAAAGWLLARRITVPLHDLLHASETISAGDYSGRVAVVTRHDEIGRLGRAFNVMAEHVEEGYRQLDTRVRDRTHELEQAVAALETAQDQLVRREKLATLGQLASGVGHELRNPLGVMTNAVYYLEMVQRDAAADVREYHGILRAQIGLAEKIVSDLLDFARVKTPRREPVPLSRLVDDQLARLSVPDEIRVDKDLSASLPIVHVDSVQIGQVVFNLLINAIQAMEPDGGVLTIRGRTADEAVTLEVSDTGRGVAPELRDKIFEPLFTTKARGIGLGLAVSRGLAEANRGQLTLAPAPDGTAAGATLALTLPTSRETRA